MNYAMYLLGGALLFAGCRKSEETNFREAANFTITSTQAPATRAQGEPILSRVVSYGPNACYRFEKMEVQATAAREFAIRSRGTVLRGNVACAEVLVQVDTTVSIPTPTAGQYILRYYNGATPFKADTVQVN
ncbi:hypothetical protein EPD60_02835 [Flaviaesturariibacter flavus]|uniref:Lipoprotein n=1 Tax=Flaviaesturariibacter flavus TaxID=2502780 RepID=A0A4R1BQ77_9BACT|nr:hypothetical protein [Flaviaesturariibacter flavus]TCJ19365.1 hypothetical protein EPD60_02835 [Flaviaesturariibacter flavus]